MPKGFLALILHAHLPYVRHPEQGSFLEERWFYEALTENYLPLLEMFNRLSDDGIPFRVTLSLSPTLLSMMADRLLQERFDRYLQRLIALAEHEVERTSGDHDLQGLAVMYRDQFLHLQDYYRNRLGGNLIKAFRDLEQRGGIELITCCATHGYLPLMLTQEARQAQIRVAAQVFEQYFGFRPRGFWLPECGYTMGVDKLLREVGIEYFFTDTHGIMFGYPRPRFGCYRPVICPSGVAAFGRDQESSKQVWSAKEGYPGDYHYREFYRDIGFDLDFELLRDFLSEAIRVDTGIKYYRITGPTVEKQLYDPEQARERAAQHAANFLFNRERQIEHLADEFGVAPVVTAPYDAELFGHWWYEGPQWLDFLIRQVNYDQHVLKLTTPSDYLRQQGPFEKVRLEMSSWGNGGFSEVWLDPTNDWIYRPLHRAETEMQGLTARFPDAQGVEQRSLNQAARELLLAQSSDWPFIIKTGSVVQYAEKRVREHLANFYRLCETLERGKPDEKLLNALEQRDNLFPGLDYRVYGGEGQVLWRKTPRESFKVLVLSWEFPPHTVGGLGRHVYDLARAQVNHGVEVYVLTQQTAGSSPREEVEGVQVIRVPVFQPPGDDFLGWTCQLNLNLVDMALDLEAFTGPFDLVHAHDWLVASAAEVLQHRWGVPLIATIHATEHGRNNGIHTGLQQLIHRAEQQLVSAADWIICCSQAMRDEVARLFGRSRESITVIPNGVDLRNLGAGTAPRSKADILFIGRLVPEKGVQHLIEAAPAILHEFPEARVLITGSGPFEPELRRIAQQLGLADQVCFLGFVDDQYRNNLLVTAAAAIFPSLYEPFGIVALEAMAAGAPVVVTETGGLQEIVKHGVDGLKCYPGDVAGLAAAINQLLGDPELVQRLTAGAGEKIRSSYDWGVLAEKTIAVYRKVLSNKIEDSSEGG